MCLVNEAQRRADTHLIIAHVATTTEQLMLTNEAILHLCLIVSQLGTPSILTDYCLCSAVCSYLLIQALQCATTVLLRVLL